MYEWKQRNSNAGPLMLSNASPVFMSACKEGDQAVEQVKQGRIRMRSGELA